MKKFLVLIIMILGLVSFNVKGIDLPKKTDHEIVNINLFYLKSCGHCEAFLKYFMENYDEKYADYFKINAYDVEEYENNKLFNKVTSKFKLEEGAVPVIIIGDFSQQGFGSDGKKLIDEALKKYKDDSYEDEVEKLIKKEKIKNINAETLDEVLIKKDFKKAPEKKHISNGVLIGATVIALVICAIGFAVMMKKY